MQDDKDMLGQNTHLILDTIYIFSIYPFLIGAVSEC